MLAAVGSFGVVCNRKDEMNPHWPGVDIWICQGHLLWPPENTRARVAQVPWAVSRQGNKMGWGWGTWAG